MRHFCSLLVVTMSFHLKPIFHNRQQSFHSPSSTSLSHQVNLHLSWNVFLQRFLLLFNNDKIDRMRQSYPVDDKRSTTLIRTGKLRLCHGHGAWHIKNRSWTSTVAQTLFPISSLFISNRTTNMMLNKPFFDRPESALRLSDDVEVLAVTDQNSTSSLASQWVGAELNTFSG